MRRRKSGRRSAAGSQINRTSVRLCAACFCYYRPADTQCPDCGRIDTITIHSRAEAARFGELLLLQKTGKIEFLTRQHRYELHAMFGKHIGAYIADFRYYDIEKAEWITEDVKGGDASGYVMTDLSHWKIKHCEAEYGIKINIIAK